MNAQQMLAIAAELERYAEELAASAHALIIQARDIQRRAAQRMEPVAMQAPIPDGPEGTD
jgi:hypothetical protein